MSSYILREQRVRLIDGFLAEEKRRRQEFDARLEALDEKIVEAERNETETYRNPEVLVRGSVGARRKVYHSATHPCGRTQYDGGQQRGFMKMRESEAKLMDGGVLKRCHACWSD
ncbi:hypothetical protein [Streptomyces sp. Wb2n-11]|uniref:hypothetical protein n=1 Tax=Streptomyces sp. Wb2n-11 TaxID=1030533 RepID=UPI000B11A753|nr:hypothetical protein [Streptomyces sp. Wb2n-11]